MERSGSMTIMIVCLMLTIFGTLIECVPIDNNIEGEADIECGSTSVNVSFKTRNVFEGKVYVRGHVSEPNCINQEHGRRVATLVLPFQTCGLQRTRSLNPKGIFVTASVVVSFHSQVCLLNAIDKV